MDVQQALADPFPADAVGWKAQTTSRDKTRALAVAYIDARDVMDRLDAVAGVAGWCDAYELLQDGAVVCRLSVRVGDEWVTKADVGGQSDQPDDGDKIKAAFSDALKRAAVKFGVGRYLYRLPQVWVAYDEQRKQLKETPSLPAWALPQTAPKPKVMPPAQPPAKGSAPVAQGTGGGTAGATPGGSGTGGPAPLPAPARLMATEEQLERLAILREGLADPAGLDANLKAWIGTEDMRKLTAAQADKLIKKLTPEDAPRKAGSAA